MHTHIYTRKERTQKTLALWHFFWHLICRQLQEWWSRKARGFKSREDVLNSFWPATLQRSFWIGCVCRFGRCMSEQRNYRFDPSHENHLLSILVPLRWHGYSIVSSASLPALIQTSNPQPIMILPIYQIDGQECATRVNVYTCWEQDIRVCIACYILLVQMRILVWKNGSLTIHVESNTIFSWGAPVGFWPAKRSQIRFRQRWCSEMQWVYSINDTQTQNECRKYMEIQCMRQVGTLESVFRIVFVSALCLTECGTECKATVGRGPYRVYCSGKWLRALWCHALRGQEKDGRKDGAIPALGWIGWAQQDMRAWKRCIWSSILGRGFQICTATGNVWKAMQRMQNRRWNIWLSELGRIQCAEGNVMRWRLFQRDTSWLRPDVWHSIANIQTIC